MIDNDLDSGLAGLADHARGTGMLESAAGIRGRGDRRRRKQVASVVGIVVLSVLGAGLALGRLDNPRQPQLPVATAPAASPSSPSSPSPEAILNGERQVYLQLVQDGESVLAADSNGRMVPSGSGGDQALLVLVPEGESYRFKTGKLRQDGAALCLAIKDNGANPLTIKTTSCIGGDPDQLFTVAPHGQDAEGRTTYAISSQSIYLQWFRYGTNGLIAEELGDAELDTTFAFLDQGRADLS